MFQLISTYHNYAIDCNKHKIKLQEQNNFNTRLEFILEITRA